MRKTRRVVTMFCGVALVVACDAAADRLITGPKDLRFGNDSVPGDTTPPDTTPPDTIPPDTVPPDTIPPDTIPPDTVPPDTIPPDTLPPPVDTVQRGKSVTGGGTQIFFGQFRQFAFSAVRHRDGSVSGQFEFRNGANDSRIHGRVTCFNVSGNLARLGGVIEKSRNGPPPGAGAVWSVADNGEGRDSVPDFLSPVLASDTTIPMAHCMRGVLLPQAPISSGNIQVRP